MMDTFEIFPERTDLTALHASVNEIKTQLHKVIVGQEDAVEMMLVGLFAGGHMLIEGVPGIAKTLLAKLLAKCLSVQFSRIQFTPDLMPSDVLGTSVFNPATVSFELKKGPIFSNVVLIDEINRAPAKTQSALFEVMEEKQITIDGVSHGVPSPFIVMATQNPIEQEGTYRLPEAQLDRFMFKIVMGYPKLNDEVEIITRHHTSDADEFVSQVPSFLTADDIVRYRKQIHLSVVEPNLIRYIANIVVETRENKFLYLGASPRASIAVLNSAKAMSAIRGRDFVTPEDIVAVTPAILRHRILLNPEKEMEGISADTVIKDILQRTEIPR